MRTIYAEGEIRRRFEGRAGEVLANSTRLPFGYYRLNGENAEEMGAIRVGGYAAYVFYCSKIAEKARVRNRWS